MIVDSHARWHREDDGTWYFITPEGEKHKVTEAQIVANGVRDLCITKQLDIKKISDTKKENIISIPKGDLLFARVTPTYNNNEYMVFDLGEDPVHVKPLVGMMLEDFGTSNLKCGSNYEMYAGDMYNIPREDAHNVQIKFLKKYEKYHMPLQEFILTKLDCYEKNILHLAANIEHLDFRMDPITVKTSLYNWNIIMSGKPVIFDIDKDLINLLKMTKNTICPKRLPFPTIFINQTFELNDETVFGLLLSETPNQNGEGFDILFGSSGIETKNLNVKWVDGMWQDGHGSVLTIDDNNEYRKNLTLLIMNIVDFINDPEVEHVENKGWYRGRRTVKKYPTYKQPKHRRIILKGKIKKYFESLSKGTNFHYSHKFWVRGHWRHFNSDWYVEKRGKKTWIPPYIKGNGLLVPKRYKLTRVDKK